MATQRFSEAPPGFVPAAAYDRLQALADSQAERIIALENAYRAELDKLSQRNYELRFAAAPMTDTTTADDPGALLLALRLDSWAEHDEGLRGDDMRTAAATLRRLHALAAQEDKPAVPADFPARILELLEEVAFWEDRNGELLQDDAGAALAWIAARAKEGKA